MAKLKKYLVEVTVHEEDVEISTGKLSIEAKSEEEAEEKAIDIVKKAFTFEARVIEE